MLKKENFEQKGWYVEQDDLERYTYFKISQSNDTTSDFIIELRYYKNGNIIIINLINGSSISKTGARNESILRYINLEMQKTDT